MRMNIFFVAGMAVAGAALLASPSQAQNAPAQGTLGIPNATAPTDSVRQGKAGINAAEAETTRTTGNAELDARATAENKEAGVGDPALTGNANATATIAANSNAKSTRARGSNEQEITRELNRQQAANASAQMPAR